MEFFMVFRIPVYAFISAEHLMEWIIIEDSRSSWTPGSRSLQVQSQKNRMWTIRMYKITISLKTLWEPGQKNK